MDPILGASSAVGFWIQHRWVSGWMDDGVVHRIHWIQHVKMAGEPYGKYTIYGLYSVFDHVSAILYSVGIPCHQQQLSTSP